LGSTQNAHAAQGSPKPLVEGGEHSTAGDSHGLI
jgi:hypothetical protein